MQLEKPWITMVNDKHDNWNSIFKKLKISSDKVVMVPN